MRSVRDVDEVDDKDERFVWCDDVACAVANGQLIDGTGAVPAERPLIGAPGGVRTPSLPVRSGVLVQSSWGRKNGAVCRASTDTVPLEGRAT